MSLKSRLTSFLKEPFFILFNYASDKDAKNIERALQRKALQDTVDLIYVTDMHMARPFRDRFSLLKYCLECTKIDGLYLEFGVFEGKSINYIASHTNHTIYGFDSFEGLPEKWRGDAPQGIFAMEQLPSVRDTVILKKGWFTDTIPIFLSEESDFCSFIHVDCDLYSSTKTILDLLKSRITKDTIIVFDEFFNYPGWQNHEYKAFKEYIEKNQVNFEYIAYNARFEQVAVRIL